MSEVVTLDNVHALCPNCGSHMSHRDIPTHVPDCKGNREWLNRETRITQLESQTPSALAAVVERQSIRIAQLEGALEAADRERDEARAAREKMEFPPCDKEVLDHGRVLRVLPIGKEAAEAHARELREFYFKADWYFCGGRAVFKVLDVARAATHPPEPD